MLDILEAKGQSPGSPGGSSGRTPTVHMPLTDLLIAPTPENLVAWP